MSFYIDLPAIFYVDLPVSFGIFFSVFINMKRVLTLKRMTRSNKMISEFIEHI